MPMKPNIVVKKNDLFKSVLSLQCYGSCRFKTGENNESVFHYFRESIEFRLVLRNVIYTKSLATPG